MLHWESWSGQDGNVIKHHLFLSVCPGKYVGSRPIKLRKSMWKDRNIEVVRKKQKEKKKLGLR